MGKNKFKRQPGATLDDRRKVLRDARKQFATESAKTKTSPQYNVDQLLDKAEDCINRFEYEIAQKFCQRALEIEADNIRALETTGTLLLELGNPESAKQCLGRVVEISPDKGHEKYMYLGQLFEGAQAVECYQKGIELMLKEKENQQALEVAAACGGPQSVTDSDISGAYSAIAELYMTDLCFEDEAESKCKTFIEKAIDIDKENPEGYQLMASFLLSKDDKENAKDVMKKSVSLWLPKFKALDKGEVTDQDNTDPVEAVPLGYDTRISTTKILIEVDEYETAIDVAESLLDENDEVPQVWYLIGWANFSMGEDYKSNARYYLEKCKKLCAKLKYEDEELLKHVDELLSDIGPGDEDEEDDGKNGQEEVEIESDSDEENMEH
ncbi:uncharacterized protein LOC143046239 [Mytilus galloprovincialis]|uniref:uncharacterized protein LOC143046239 n=1 Tax=Mytilus galloprovincialis TaxID=29158 RepID=UPI003F7B4C83